MIPKFIKGLKKDLPTTGFIEGAYYQCEDTGELFYATNSTTLTSITKNVDDLIENLQEEVEDLENNKQDKLESGTNIKTINLESVLGEGNIVVTEAQYEFIDEVTDPSTIEFLENKNNPVYQVVILKDSTSPIKLIPKSNVTKGFLNKILFKNTGTTEYTFDYSAFDKLYKEEDIVISANKIAEITWMLLEDGTYVIYKSTEFNSDTPVPPTSNYLVFTARENGCNLYYEIMQGSPNHNFQYSTDGGNTWAEWSPSYKIPLNKDQSVFVKGQNTTVSTYVNSYLTIKTENSKVIDITGNIMALLDDGAGVAMSVPDYCFYWLFKDFTTRTAPVLPATTVGKCAYYRLFDGCTNLTTAPNLPATNLGDGCYVDLFSGCTNLVNIPNILPATNITEQCYMRMFYKCSSLTKVPILPATVLKELCYGSMFEECTSLTTPPVLSSRNLASRCYESMFRMCANLQEAPELPATTLAESCYSSMFQGCTSLKTAPDLLAPVLLDWCYGAMFFGCSQLTYIKCLATDISSANALANWVKDVAPSGDFYYSYGMGDTWKVDNDSGIPIGWTKHPVGGTGNYLVFSSPLYNTGSVKYTTVGTPNHNFQYSKDKVNWIDWEPETPAPVVDNYDKLYVRGFNPQGISTSPSNYVKFVPSKTMKVSGNIMSLIDGIGETKKIPCNYCFYEMFGNTTTYILDTAVELPATTLTEGCYERMFVGWGRWGDVTAVPMLPATTLAKRCYKEMFSGTDIKQAPELPAPILTESCYEEMFNGCQWLADIRCYATDVSARYALENWVSGIASNGDFYLDKDSESIWPTGSSGIPTYWTKHLV